MTPNVAALAEHLRAVGVGELDDMVIENLAEVLAGAYLASALAVGLHGCSPFAQLSESKLWMCCSQIWSPLSQLK